jgi:hypothetical protein
MIALITPMNNAALRSCGVGSGCGAIAGSRTVILRFTSLPFRRSSVEAHSSEVTEADDVAEPVHHMFKTSL